jgi:hypothetical protein
MVLFLPEDLPLKLGGMSEVAAAALNLNLNLNHKQLFISSVITVHI